MYHTQIPRCERFFGLLANEVITNEFGIWQSTDILHYFEGVRLGDREE